MLNWIKKLVGDSNEKAVRQLQPLVEEINGLENEFKGLSDEQLRGKTAEFRQRLEEGDMLEDILPEAFAAVREAARRTIGQRHYDVQLIGGIVLHQGKIAEMKTGEGKTLVATLPLYLNALEGKGAHLVTVNDYLAKVGAGWMGSIYHFLGLSVGFIAHEYSALYDPDFIDPTANQEDQRLVHWRPCRRREAYAADITYGTNNEFGFDFLRDNMAFEAEQIVQRELHYAIVDEVDNILIDEARTPLIISGPSNKSSEQYKRVARLVPGLTPSPYTPDQVKKEFIDDPEGDFMLDPRTKSVQLTDAGVVALERKFGIAEDESLYDPKYNELTHYVENALRAQFIYHRDRDYVVEPDGEVVIVDEFTGRKMPGRRWSDGLHQAIEAKETLLNPRVEIKNENVTLATITFQNYFRMYAKLSGMTGTAYTEREELGKIYNLDVVMIPTNRPMVRDDMPDQIYGVEAAKFNAVVREVEEMRALGRPVLIGTTSVETSERLSELLKRAGVPHNVLNAKQHEREAGIVAQAGRKGAVTVATNMAGRGTDILLGGNPDGLVEEILEERGIKLADATPEQRADALAVAKRITDAERDEVRALGGLHIVGTERHEARRIDNQLRGRAGRQGDPGSSRFFMSLEDDLMRRFGPMQRIQGIMNKLGVDADTPIEASLIDRSIEGAQTRVEGYNFDIRKHTVEFDDVMNTQRKIIYADRHAIMDGQDMRDRVLELIGEEVAAQVDQYLPAGDPELWDVEGLLRAMRTIDPMLPARFTPEYVESNGRDEVESELVDAVEQAYEEREVAIGPENMRFVERRMMLAAIDRQWVDYLTAMDDLRQSISLQAFAQKDPLVEFKRKSFDMFDELKANITSDIVYNIIPASFQYEEYLRRLEAEQQARLDAATEVGVDADGEPRKVSKTARKAVQLPGRNDPCPCGSGKKFKNCHLGREGEIMHLLQAGGANRPVPASVAAQLATGNNGGSGDIAREAEAIKAAQATQGNDKPAQAGAGRANRPKGRAAPPPTGPGRGKPKR
jgi:preprotein translocase subunit SecA